MEDLSLVLSSDPWVAASLLQKAIRRGMSDIAEVAAHALFKRRGRGVWRRLVVIAVEDVGIGDVEAVVRTVQLAVDSAARLAVGSEADALSTVVRMLSSCAKDRSSDYLICSAISREDLEPARERCGSDNATTLSDVIHDPDQLLGERAVAAWYASGINVGDEPRLPKNSLQPLSAVFDDAEIPASLIWAADVASRMLRHPIPVMLPLIWLAAKDQSPWKIDQIALPTTDTTASGIPLFALDKHTSRGKAAIGLFAKRCEPVREILAEHVPEFRARDAACMAAYYADAAPVAKRLIWSCSDALVELGRDTDFRKVGIAAGGVLAVANVVADNLASLNAIRAELAG